MPWRRPGWTRFSIRMRDQTRNLERFRDSVKFGNALVFPVIGGDACDPQTRLA